MSLMETICLIPVPGTSPAILMYGFGHAERKAMLRGDSGVQNMRERGSTAPRHFLLKDEKWWQVVGGTSTVAGGTATGGR